MMILTCPHGTRSARHPEANYCAQCPTFTSDGGGWKDGGKGDPPAKVWRTENSGGGIWRRRHISTWRRNYRYFARVGQVGAGGA